MIRVVTSALLLLGSSVTFAISTPFEEIADRLAGTTSVVGRPLMSNGVLSGCSLEFNALLRDFTYRKGQPLKISGSVNLMGMQKTLGVTLKIVVNEMSQDSRGEIVFTPSAPDRAYLLSDDLTSNYSTLVTASTSDTPGALFSIYPIDPSLNMISKALDTGEIKIAFNRSGGDTDITLPINLRVATLNDDGKRILSDDAIVNFSQCSLKIVQDIQGH